MVRFGLIVLLIARVVAGGGEAQPIATSPAAIKALVKDLDAADFKKRQAAQEKLAGMGKGVISHLGKAAVGDSLEVTLRAVELLSGFLKSTDEATKDAARKALETIAVSERVSAARRARAALEPKDKKPPNDLSRLIIRGGNFGGGWGWLQGGAGARMKSVSVSTVNGVKEISVQEDSTRIRIKDDPDGGITVEVTAPAKEATKTYQAKTADELKKKHPEAYRYYQEYAKNQGGVAVAQVHIDGGGGMVRRTRIEHFLQAVERMATQLTAQARNVELRAAERPAKERIQDQIERMRKALDDLEKRLQVKAAKPVAPPKRAAEKREQPAEKRD